MCRMCSLANVLTRFDTRFIGQEVQERRGNNERMIVSRSGVLEFGQLTVVWDLKGLLWSVGV